MDASDRYNEDLKEGKQVCADLIMRVLTEGMLHGDGRPGHPRGCKVILKVWPRQQCSPRHRMTFNSRNGGFETQQTMLATSQDDIQLKKRRTM